MSATGGARLALVPASEGDAQAPPPLDARVRSVAKHAVSARAQRVVWGMWATGCAMLFVGWLLVPGFGDSAFLLMALGGLPLFPLGIALGCIALLDRSREAWTALLGALAALAAVLGLMAPARRAVIEMHVAANQAELSVVAAEFRAAVAASSFDPDPESGTYAQVNRRLGPRLRGLSLRGAVPVDGGLLFTTGGERDFSLFYADGVAGPPDGCVNRRLRFLGGRWFEAGCHDRSTD